MKIGVLNFGLSPWSGLALELRKLIGDEHEFLEVGALDDMTQAELEALAPRPGEQVTVTELRDGSEFLAASQRLYPMGQDCVTKLEQQGADLIFPACGGDLPDYRHTVPYVSTFRALRALIDVTLPKGTLALLIPSAKQVEKNQRWYARPGRTLVIEGASPLSDEEVCEAGRRLAAHQPDLLVMTCFLNNTRQRDLVRCIVACPVLLSRSVVARAVAELAAGWPSRTTKSLRGVTMAG